jgi:diacylglycerol kinase
MKNEKSFSVSERIKSFKPALKGLKWFLINEHNVRIHLILSIVSICTGIYFQISTNEWITILICIGLVLSMEAANSAIEKLVDLVSPQKNQIAGLVKDIAAAAVLIASMMAILVAAMIFLPKIILLF